MKIMATPQQVTKLEVTEVTEGDDVSQSERSKVFSSGFGGTINLVSTAIGGGGMFGNIFGAAQLGIFGFVIMTALSAFFTYISTEFLVTSSVISAKSSCYALSQTYLGGKMGNTLTKIFIIFGNWSFVVNVIQIFADFISYILAIWLDIDNPNSFWDSREFAVILGLLFIFPWVQSKSIKSLEKLSGAFILLCMFILVIIIVNAFKATLLNDVAPSMQLGPSSFEAFFRGLPAITWCWTVQFNVLPVYNTLDGNQNPEVMSHVSYWSYVFLFIYYTLFGFAALIIWGTRINEDFMTNLDYNDTNYVFYFGMELSTTTQFIMCVVTFASIPIFAYEARTNLHYVVMDIYHKCIKPYLVTESAGVYHTYMDTVGSEANIDHEETPLMGSEHSSSSRSRSPSESWTEDELEKRNDYAETWISRFIESGVIMTSAAVVALYLTDLNWCLSLVGATYGCYIAYFLPSIVYWRATHTIHKLTDKQKLLKFLAVVLISYGIIVCVLGVTMAFI